jgi:hypothetical protein
MSARSLPWLTAVLALAAWAGSASPDGGVVDGCRPTARQRAACAAKGAHFVFGLEPQFRCLGMEPDPGKPLPAPRPVCACFDPDEVDRRLRACREKPGQSKPVVEKPTPSSSP